MRMILESIVAQTLAEHLSFQRQKKQTLFEIKLHKCERAAQRSVEIQRGGNLGIVLKATVMAARRKSICTQRKHGQKF